MVWIKNYETIKKQLNTTFSLLIITGAIFIALKFSKECSDGILSGLSFCMTVLIPSLFIFLVIASYISSSKAFFIFSKLFGKATERLLHIPQVCSGAVLLSILGGYPVGARCAKSLYDDRVINKEQAKKLSMIAMCSGPSFVLNFVGNALLNNKKAGLILFISQIIAFVAVALICGRTIKLKDESVAKETEYKQTDLVKAVESGCKATFSMCSMVILFSAIISVCDKLLIGYPTVSDFGKILFEVTTACNSLSRKYPLHLISFSIGFGGLSVHFQIYSMLKDIGINKTLFFLFRIIQGIIAGIATYILLILFPCTTQVFSTVTDVSAHISTSVLGCCALLLTAVCFLNSLSYTKIKRR
ncbi:MAG: hypothetical protein E7513_02270 [Ruminococcaceae bacterium]|nr:hypothetical protein [Oscillospiraceae bacterium]